jgi:tRNA A-37 threonylcarbamoyl transferase component Bud32
LSAAKNLPESFEILRHGDRLVAVREDVASPLLDWGLLDLESLLRDPGRTIERSTGRASHAIVRGPDALRGWGDASGDAPEGAGPVHLFIREYRHGGATGRLLGGRFLGGRRPFREIVVSERARSSGVHTQRILACFGRRGAWFHRWYLVQEALSGYVDLIEYFTSIASSDLANRADRERKRAVIRRAAAEVRRMHDVGILHADLHLKNLMTTHAGGRCEVAIVDFDKSSGSPRLSDRRREDNLIRLDRSVEKLNRRGARISRVDRWRFLREYFRGSWPDRSRLRSFLAKRRRAISRHSVGWSLADRLRGRLDGSGRVGRVGGIDATAGPRAASGGGEGRSDAGADR